MIESILGKDSVKAEKIEVAHDEVDVIGWRLNLKKLTVTVAKKNMLKAMNCLFRVDLHENTNILALQTISSYCSRYVLICRVLAPFLSCIHRMIREHWGKKGTFPFTDEARMEVRLWRASMFLLSIDSLTYARPMASFKPRPVSVRLTTDGSLSQVGGYITAISAAGDVCLGCFAVNISTFGFGTDSSFQNTAEYIGMVLGVMACAKLGFRNIDIAIQGDSTTSLSWIKAQRVSGKAAINAAVALVTLCIHFGIEVNETLFLSGVDNFRADRLSRLVEKDLTLKQAMALNGQEGAAILDLRRDPAANKIINMCNPKFDCGDETEFKSVWKVIRESVAIKECAQINPMSEV